MLIDIILLLAGFFVGAMNAIAGGGMLLGFPAMLAVGIPPIVANASSAVVTLPGQITSAYGYRNYLRRIPRSYLWLLVPCAVGGAIGVTLLTRTSAEGFENLVPGLVLFAVLLFALQPFLHFHLHRHLRRRHGFNLTLLLIGLGFLPTAIYGGYFGAGFGFIILAFLGYTSLHDAHKMNALKNLAGVVIATVSITALWNTGLIDWRHAAVMAVGSAVGGYAGARLAQRISSHSIRIVVIVFGLITAVYLALRTY